MKNKALIVALSEFTTLVRSKAFLAGLLMMPVFMGIAIGVQRFTRDASDIKDRPFVVVDRSGVLFGPLKDAADEWNRPSAGEGAARTQPRFLPSIETFDASDERARARFMGALGIASGVLFAVAIVAQWLATVFISPCWGA